MTTFQLQLIVVGCYIVSGDQFFAGGFDQSFGGRGGEKGLIGYNAGVKIKPLFGVEEPRSIEEVRL